MLSEASQAVQAIYSLPIKQRDAVILVLAAGLTYEEAGAIMDCSPGTIKSRVSRARAVLMDELNGIVPAISNDTPGFAEQSTLHQLVIHAEELMAEAA
jgi:RNA polymerase sigma-70 factor (ECF subfamily)